MAGQDTAGALDGVRVLEVGAGVAGSYCAKLFADMGATVSRIDDGQPDGVIAGPLEPGLSATAGMYADYLHAGKQRVAPGDAGDFDVVVVGEEGRTPAVVPDPRVARVNLAWFGSDGPYADWRGADVVVQALAGLLHPVGPRDGPPQFMGVHQATTLAGATAFCAGVAALLGEGDAPQQLEVSIFESIICLAELQICHSDMLGHTVPRLGVNRFQPTCPLSIHRCKEGWIGITPITPAQWQAFLKILDLPELAREPELDFAKGRLPQVERLEAAFERRFPERTADEWAALGRQYKVPMVVVPDAAGIIAHPVFTARESFASFARDGQDLSVPRTPMRLVATPPRTGLDAPARGSGQHASLRTLGPANAPLAGLRVADFSMGWAGPLTTRMLADFGAEVIKIEAGRYPDWWRAVDWTPQAIAAKQFEQSRHFSALNRGKSSVSLDITQPAGLELAKELVKACDVVVENQAAGVMQRLGLGYETLSAGHPGLVMMSMSAFGAGNAWSDTRAYGSVLEQGSGLPSFCGQADWPPTMAHIAYGDPVGGVYGCASLLAAVFHQRRTGQGQWINNTQIEAMLPFTTPALLIRQATGREPERVGNRHPHYCPHGLFRAADGRWVAVAVDENAWPGVASVLQSAAQSGTANVRPPETPREQETAAELALATWIASRSSADAASTLQTSGAAAAVVAEMDEVTSDPHLRAREFFYDIDRPHVGAQAQAGLPVRHGGMRYPMRGLAPRLGGESALMLERHAGVTPEAFERLLDTGVVCLAPTRLRSG